LSAQAELQQGAGGLRQYASVIRRRWPIVVSLPILAVALALGLASMQTPRYEATTKIVVGQGKGLFQPGVAYAVQPFTATMGNLVKSNIVAQEVIDRLDLHGWTTQRVLSEVGVVVDPTTAVIQVSAVDTSRTRATEIVGQVGKVFSRLVKQRFGGSDTPVATTTNGALAQLPLTATIFDPAHALPGRVSPRPTRDAVIAGLLGLFLGLLGAFLREHFDRKLRTREAVEAAFGAPVIGQIPWVRIAEGEPALGSATGSAAGEAFRALRANLQYLSVNRPLRTILVTSAAAAQGKTTVTANLALAIARSGAPTVAIEADLRRPGLGNAFGHRGFGPGLTGVLVGAADPDDAVADVLVHDDVPGAEPVVVSLLQSGPLPPNPSELLASLQMQHTLDRLTAVYEHVLIDSPPLLLVADSLELARIVDGVVIVARRNSVTSEEAKEVRAVVERLGLSLVGVVLTDVEQAGGYYHAYRPSEEPRALSVGAARPDEL
jgi:capsular exopolysaccharide synthesis family protein